MHKIKLLFFLTLLVIIISCKDEPSTTPTPTPIEVEDEWPTFVDTGANVVAYKVDGKIRVTKNISKIDSTRGYISCGYLLHEKTKKFFFYGDRISDEIFESLNIIVDDLGKTGYYKLENYSNNLNIGSYYVGPSEAQAKGFATNEVDTGFVIITKIDTIKGVITGRFEFNGQYVFGTEKKRITEGRFDLKYYR